MQGKHSRLKFNNIRPHTKLFSVSTTASDIKITRPPGFLYLKYLKWKEDAWYIQKQQNTSQGVRSGQKTKCRHLRI